MMNDERRELLKQAYAYGASLALRDAGVDMAHAEDVAIKLAEDHDAHQHEGHPILGTVGGAAAGALGMGALGAASGLLPGMAGGKGLMLSKLLGKNKSIGGFAAKHLQTPTSFVEGAFKGKAPLKQVEQWRRGKLPNQTANEVQENWYRGLGGAGIGTLGGGLAGGIAGSGD
jgi:hypothetical protein